MADTSGYLNYDGLKTYDELMKEWVANHINTSSVEIADQVTAQVKEEVVGTAEDTSADPTIYGAKKLAEDLNNEMSTTVDSKIDTKIAELEASIHYIDSDDISSLFTN